MLNFYYPLPKKRLKLEFPIKFKLKNKFSIWEQFFCQVENLWKTFLENKNYSKIMVKT